jgi:hypothetical protein
VERRRRTGRLRSVAMARAEMIDRLNEADAEDELRVINKQLTRLCFRVQPLPRGK